jgi:surfeit locus 1 family protein
LTTEAARRWPLIPTVIVAAAVATMIGLGLWQLLDRRPKKLAYIAQLSQNPSKPPVAFPRLPDDALLFRRTTGFCTEPTSIRTEGAGSRGFRLIAECRTGGLEGPGMAVQLGTTRDPNFKPAWRGGGVAGFISHAPDQRSALAGLFDRTPQRLMLALDRPPAGLSPNPPPDVSAVPNPHLSYAFQWFFFALSAAVIYVLALRRRRRG